MKNKKKKLPDNVPSNDDWFVFNRALYDSLSFRKIAHFALFENPFAQNTLIKPNLSDELHEKSKETGEIGMAFLEYFGPNLWCKNAIVKTDNELQKGMITSEFGSLFIHQFAYFKKTGVGNTNVDSFFIHVRNAFAHGRVVRIETDSRGYYFLEDVLPSAFISARICVSELFLIQLIDTIKKYTV